MPRPSVSAIPDRPQEILLSARGVVKRFGSFTAVNRMDLDVRRGEIVGLIGPNGAGKSTFFNVLAGALKPNAGRVVFNGTDITGFPPHRVARMGLARTFQIPRPIQRMSVLENVLIAPQAQRGEHLWGLLRPAAVRAEEERIRERAKEELRFFELDRLRDDYAGALSGGQKKLLELARAAMADPSMLLLDEPLAGVNPTLGRKIMDKIQSLRNERGITCLLVEHDMRSVFRYSDRIVVMAEGRKLAEGNQEHIQQDAAVLNAYLGAPEEA